MIAILKNVLFGINRHHNNRSPLAIVNRFEKQALQSLDAERFSYIIALFDKSKHLFNRYSHDVIRLALVDDEELTIAEEFLVRWGDRLNVFNSCCGITVIHAT